MSQDADTVTSGGDIATPVAQPVDGPVNAHQAADLLRQARDRSDAGRTLAAARKPQEQAPAPVEAAVEPKESGDEPGAAPPPEAHGEAQEAEPAEVPPIEPPASWTKEAKERWQSLPRETQEYLARREQERDREVRRSQNEAAEKLKGVSTKEQQLEQARQQYEAALPALLRTLQQTQMGEFADVKTHADLERLAAEDPARYLRWDAAQKKIAAVARDVQVAQERNAHKAHAEFAEFAKSEDEKFLQAAPEFADKDKAAKLQGAAIDALKDLGFSEDELGNLWNGQERLSLRDHRVQLLIRDGVKYREAQAAAQKAVAKTLPPVQRPGTPQPKGAAQQQQREAIAAQLPKLKGQDALRAAAKLIGMNRQAAR